MKRGRIAEIALGIISLGAIFLYNYSQHQDVAREVEANRKREKVLTQEIQEQKQENERLKGTVQTLTRAFAAEQAKPTPFTLYAQATYLVHLEISGQEKPLLPIIPPTPLNGKGAGVLVRLGEKLFVLTAGHNIPNLETHEIKSITALANIPGTTARAVELHGWDPEFDLALLRYKDDFAYDGSVAEFGDSAWAMPYTPVMALGSPMGLQFSGTLGHITNTRGLGIWNAPATLHIYRPQALLHSAKLIGGNSGGPLLSAETGKVIGINTAIIFTPSENGHIGDISVAIPSEDIIRLLPKLALGGRVKHGFIPGLNITDSLNVPTSKLPGGARPIQEGVLVTFANPQLLGGKTFEMHDIIIKLSGNETISCMDFTREIMHTEPGVTVMISVLRQGKLLEIPVTLEEHIMP